MSREPGQLTAPCTSGGMRDAERPAACWHAAVRPWRMNVMTVAKGMPAALHSVWQRWQTDRCASEAATLRARAHCVLHIVRGACASADATRSAGAAARCCTTKVRGTDALLLEQAVCGAPATRFQRQGAHSAGRAAAAAAGGARVCRAGARGCRTLGALPEEGNGKGRRRRKQLKEADLRGWHMQGG